MAWKLIPARTSVGIHTSVAVAAPVTTVPTMVSK
jgi:hypothetical protein